jgi:integrase
VPRLPKGMFRRGRSYYVRLRKGYSDRWVSLGSEYDEACRTYREILAGAIPAVRVSVGTAVQQWLETYIRNARNAKGVVLAERRVELYFRPFFRNRELVGITAEDVRRYRLFLERHDITPQTVFHLLADAGCFFNWSVDSGLLVRSPVPRRIMPRIQERPPERLSDEAIAAITALPDPYGFTARLGLGTGLRWGELVRLERSDFGGGCLVVHQTKSGKVRRVPVPPELQAEIVVRNGCLVPFNPPTPNHFSWAVKKRTGFAFHAHQMRHTFACRWLERGGSLAALQAMLGHASIVTTQRYARLSEDHVRAEAERLSKNSVAVPVASDSSRTSLPT